MRRIPTALAVLLLAAMPARASLIGTQVTGTFKTVFDDDIFAVAGIPQPAIIAEPGIEFSTGSKFQNRIEADFGAASLTLRFVTLWHVGAYARYTATFTFLTPGIVTGVAVQPGGTIPLYSDPALSGDVLTFRTDFAYVDKGTTLSITLSLFSRLGGGTPVPAPGALALLGASLLGLGVVRRLRAA